MPRTLREWTSTYKASIGPIFTLIAHHQTQTHNLTPRQRNSTTSPIHLRHAGNVIPKASRLPTPGPLTPTLVSSLKGNHPFDPPPLFCPIQMPGSQHHLCTILTCPNKPSWWAGPASLNLPNTLMVQTTPCHRHHHRELEDLALGIVLRSSSKGLSRPMLSPKLALSWGGCDISLSTPNWARAKKGWGKGGWQKREEEQLEMPEISLSSQGGTNCDPKQHRTPCFIVTQGWAHGLWSPELWV